MPAPDIQTLYRFRSTIEPEIKNALVTAGLPDAAIYISRSAPTRATPCLSVGLQMGAANNHRVAPPTLSYYIFDQWECSVDVELKTNRGTNATSHEDYEALIRMTMPDVFARVNPQLLYHAFAEAFQDTNSNYSFDSENNIDVSRLSFRSVLAIKRDAWPAS